MGELLAELIVLLCFSFPFFIQTDVWILKTWFRGCPCVCGLVPVLPVFGVVDGFVGREEGRKEVVRLVTGSDSK